MERESYRRRNAQQDEFDLSLMYDDIEKIREREEEEEKDQNGKLGSAGMMAFFAGLAILAASRGGDRPGWQGFGIQSAAWGAINLGIVAAAATSSNGDTVRNHFSALGQYHTRKGVSPNHYGLWIDTLIDTASEFDPYFDDEVAALWHEMMKRVREAMVAAESK